MEVPAGGRSFRPGMPAELCIKILRHLFTDFKVALRPYPHCGGNTSFTTLANVCGVCCFFNETATELVSDRVTVYYRDGDLLGTMTGGAGKAVFQQASKAAAEKDIAVWNREIVLSIVIPMLKSLKIDIPTVHSRPEKTDGNHLFAV